MWRSIAMAVGRWTGDPLGLAGRQWLGAGLDVANSCHFVAASRV